MLKSTYQKLNFKISYLKYCLLYCGLMFGICNFTNYQKIAIWFNNQQHIDYLGLLAFFTLAFSTFFAFFLLVCHPKSIKFFSIILCILSTIVLYFINKYDVSIDRTMIMNALYTDTSEVHSLLSSQMISYILFFTIIPSFVILKTQIIFPKKYFYKSIFVILITLATSAIFGYAKFQSIHLATNLSRKKIIYTVMPINYIRSSFSVIDHLFIKPHFSQKAKEIKISGKITQKEDLVIVLAIGETSRQKNFSLYGYNRPTNPILSNIKNLHILNGKARLGSTLYALPEILVKNDIPLTALTSKLGIDTKCFVNYSLYNNCAIPGETKVENCKHDICYDEDVIPYLEQDLKSYQQGYRFIVLHIGGGSHGPSYHERYPPEFQIFKPICRDADVVNKCTKEELFNTFDNTILYVDYVVGNIIKTLDKSKLNYVFFYLSDHGESLLEDGRIFHGTPPGIDLPIEQAQIPLLVKSSLPIKIEKFSEYKQPQIYDSIVKLFNIEAEGVKVNESFIKR